MPKNQQDSGSLSLPQLLQLAGIGGQSQQDSTREAFSYMMGQQRIASEDADRKVRQQQAEQENAYRMKALDAQVNQKDNTAALHALGLLYANTMDPTERARIGAYISNLTGMPAASAVAPEKTYENDPKLQPGYKAQTGATITKDGIGTALGQVFNKFDPTTTADYAGNEVLNQLMNFIYSAGGYDPGPRIPTATDEATAQFVSDAQYNTKKHMENKKRRAAGLPTIEEEVAKYKKPEPVAWYDFPTQVLNLERAQAVEEAQKQTAEYLNRKAALRQAAGFQP